jgi:hypothetical protein
MRTKLLILLFLPVILLWNSAHAQHSPYAHETDRPVKALSEQEVADYLAGRGMGMAKAAELNGYPGPLHVLELSHEVGLTVEQRARTHALFDAMQKEARSLGLQLVDREARLDTAFSTKSITTESLAQATQDVAGLAGKLREVHLRAHLAQVAILTPAQMATYDELRGYRSHDSQHHHPGTAPASR